MLRRLLRPARRVPLWLVLTIVTPFLFEVLIHRSYWRVPTPPTEQDTPFYTQCQEPDIHAPRENAAMVMLARNRELKAVNATITSIHNKFNKWFRYPIILFNDDEWDPKFIKEINKTSDGLAQFENVPPEIWSFPPWIDPKDAKASIKDQGDRHIQHAGEEGYHHMCRFFSGGFYKMEALKKYKWYWRLEPDVEFYCHITYDPFREMALHRKVYGFTVALWEVAETCPKLFRSTADWKEANKIPTTNLWKAVVSASYVPWPFRSFLSFLSHRDSGGDEWSLCHYWSNFEIADMDFFRSTLYMDYFEYLDRLGGFYYERWGDAAVHSLAIQMLADPSRVHHFEDIGYRHDKLYQCPSNALGGQLEESSTLGDAPWSMERAGGVGCRCDCDDVGGKTRNIPGYCLNKLKQPNTVKRPWFTWLI